MIGQEEMASKCVGRGLDWVLGNKFLTEEACQVLAQAAQGREVMESP